MKTVTRLWVCFAVLSLACVATPAFAQDSMQGMDMTHVPHQTKKPTQTATDKQAQRTKENPGVQKRPPMHMSSMSGMSMQHKPARKETCPAKKPQHGPTKPTAHAMQRMHMPPLHGPCMQAQAWPNLTGAMQKLDIGSEIGHRPVVQGLNLQPMHMAMQGMQMQGGKAPANARSANYSDGIGYGPLGGAVMAGEMPRGMVLIDRLEYYDSRDGHGVALDAQGWYGTDANKLWVKAEGETDAGRLQNLRLEALWDHPVAAFWDMQLGVRHDFGIGPGRTWAAFGVQGLAPYKFDVQATGYIGPAGRTAFRFEVEYEMRFTQRLNLQPRLEANLYGRDDPQRRIGSGLSDAEFGLRLRYEMTRQFVPYVGVVWESRFGKTADFARNAGEHASETRLVAGVHMWF